MRLRGQVAIVTGAARSIGAAVARRYAREGASVVVVDLLPELAEQVAASIRDDGGDAFAIQADVSVEAEVRAAVDETVRRYGTVHVLVNNAGIDPRCHWHEITGDEWDRVMNTNVKSQFYCAKAVFPHMKTQGYGKIINVSSVTFFTGQRNLLHYVASKGAVVGFTRALAREVGEHGIAVNCVTPGAVLTETEGEDMHQYDPARLEREMAELQSFQRRETAGDLEGVFVFLAASDSDFLTGQTLNVDGGWIMH
ncbi:SDR family NAD(P)-dependent oxidoreductase [Cohnella hashimotonis]|uniref:3-oxoacyl-ACP reductase family protein n=1 Tax=Cohnella hashimotonis TaxID=2826895 RepID=A0ABT6TKT6_9BACL|nr:3-oxoacyl-ACP reductase family protein [Cohnella hashimotonis]MDI4647452.1 3-oxoacyl-ACP reductase family protein [Cohnella hashimotonis]